jgi:hypothetical protein
LTAIFRIISTGEIFLSGILRKGKCKSSFVASYEEHAVKLAQRLGLRQ